jgi:hypothetical protein
MSNQESFHTIPPQEEPRTLEEVRVRESLDQNAAVAAEASLLESIGEKAKKMAKVMTVVSALSFGAGLPQDADAAGPSVTVKVETSDRGRQVAAERVSSAGQLFQSMVEHARRDQRAVVYSEDAEALLQKHFDRFVGEYFNPTHGRLRDSVYGVKVRNYNDADHAAIKASAIEMKGLLLDLYAQYEIDDYEGRLVQIDEMIKKVSYSATDVGKIEKALKQQVEKQLGRQLNIKITIPPIFHGR